MSRGRSGELARPMSLLPMSSVAVSVNIKDSELSGGRLRSVCTALLGTRNDV